MSRLTARGALLLLLLAPVSGFVHAENKAPGALPATSPGPAPASGAGPAAPATGSHTPAPEPKPLPVATISANAEAADASLRAIDEGLVTPGAIATIAAELGPFAREFDTVARASRAALAGREQRGRIGDAEADLQALQGRLAGWERTLRRRAEELEGQLGRLTEMRRTWQATDDLARSGDVPRGASDRTAAVLGSIDRLRKRVESVRESLFTLQDRVSRFQARASEHREKLKQAMTLAVGGLMVRDSPPLWGDAVPAAGDRSQPSLPAAIAARLAGSYANAADYVGANQGRLTLLPIILLLFLVGLWLARWQLRRRIDDEPELKAASWLLERPVAATLLATALCSPWVLMYAPREINLLMLAFALPPTILILRRAIDPRLAPFLYALLVLYVLSRLLELLDGVPTVERVLFQLQMLATIGVLAWLLRRHRIVRRESAVSVSPSVNWTVRGIRAAAAGFAAALAADLSGFTQLGRFIADASLGAIYTAVILYAGVQVVYGLIRLALNLWPLQALAMVQHHKRTVESNARKATRWSAIVGWLFATLELLALLDPVKDRLTAIATATFQLGEIGISLGGILTFVLTIWGAVLLSRLVRFILDQELFSRWSLPRGLPYALTTVLHYALLVGGVLIAIVSTGVNLDRFTIIAGALGVGAGFGLQGIVNNFVSGLILLFERPIKVGDSVEMASRGGQIQHIGIRACVMRTGDGAEIIVPNSMMIAGEVTNWTLNDRQRRIEIPIGIAYGNDPERVMALLTQVAQAHADVLDFPAPETQFAGFGPHALEFKLGAWTGRPERGGTIRSELCVGIYRVLTRENIEIPFPQSTLHLRSVDSTVLDTVRTPAPAGVRRGARTEDAGPDRTPEHTTWEPRR